MTSSSERASRPIRSALFVDFDNTYLQLCRHDRDIAEAFATYPQNWISWLEKSSPRYVGLEECARRNILVRRCYLSPEQFGDYRTNFVQGGFDVVDCPALTGQGKNSADIHMVIDALDLLNHQIVYDEIIIMSGDADFRPVLLKFREWDRRTAILAFGHWSPAYGEASDHVIDHKAFIKDALSKTKRSSSDSIKKNCSKLIQNLVREASQAVPMGALAPKIREKHPDIGPDWLGEKNFKPFVKSLDLGNLKVSDHGPGYVYDPSQHPPPEPQSTTGKKKK